MLPVFVLRTVRDAALNCLGEAFRHVPNAVLQLVQTSGLRTALQREVLLRLSQYGPLTVPLPELSAAEQLSSSTASKRPPQLAKEPVAAGQDGPDGGQALPSSTTSSDDGAVRVDVVKRGAPMPAAAAAAAAAPAAPAKRGGYMDAGGVTADGDLPPAAPVPVSSERELRAEMEAATAVLAQAPNADWQQRMATMVRVEGLVLGGAAEYESYAEGVKALTSALTLQFKERRSSIARQACHLVGVLARSMGSRFEANAVTILPTLFGVLIITIQVRRVALRGGGWSRGGVPGRRQSGGMAGEGVTVAAASHGSRLLAGACCGTAALGVSVVERQKDEQPANCAGNVESEA